MRVLLVEDHADVAETISDYLVARGHQVEMAADGEQGYRLASTQDYDAIVLDRILPLMDGATLCGRLRSEAGRNTPVLMLTALGSTSDKLTGFSAGADDYLVKPFDLPELEARLLALHRRSSSSHAQGQRLQVADLVYDLEAHHVTRAGKALTLSPMARRILEHLMRQTQRVVPRAEIEALLWGDSPPDGDVLPVHIHALRHAVDDSQRRKLLHTVRGVGYRLALLDGS